MKNYFFLLVSFFLLGVKSQEIPPIKKERLNRFFSSKLMVVKNEDPFGSYNEVLVKSMEKIWKLTPYEVIESSEFEKKMSNPNLSFLYLSEGEYSEGNKTARMNLFNLSLGNRAGKINGLQDVILVPLNYIWKEEEDEESEFLYKVPGLLRMFQYVLEINKTTPEISLENICKQNEGNLPNMEVWFLEDNVTNELKNNSVDLQKYFKGSIKLASKEEMMNAALNGQSNVALGYCFDPGNNPGFYYLKFIISASDGKVLYYRFGKATSGRDGKFSISDLKSFK